MGNAQSVTEIWASDHNIKWSKEGRDDLLKSIKTTMHGNDEEKLNIILFGEMGSGKSSLGSGFITALRKRQIVSKHFSEAGGTFTGTKVLHVTKLDDVNLIDAPGLLETSDITEKDILAIVEGRVPFYAQLNRNLHIEDTAQLGNPAQYNKNAVCVVIVIKHGDEISDNVIGHISLIVQLAAKGVLTYRIVLTHVDQLDPKFKDKTKLQSVYHSKAVKQAALNISEKIDVPLSYISVVRNYSIESHSDLYTDILLLHSLNLIMSSARDQAEKVAARKCMNERFGDQSPPSSDS